MKVSVSFIKDFLNGCEVYTSKGVVGVSNGIATRSGETLLLSDKQWKSLWKSYVKSELG